MNRYVYHAPWEIPPRSVASGDQNVVGLGALALVEAMPSAEVNDCMGCGPMRYDPIVRMPVRLVLPPAASAGATATVPQPPPTSGGTLLVANPGVLPLSPQPSPTVAVNPTQTAPSLPTPGQVVTSAGSTPTAWAPYTQYGLGQSVVDGAGHLQQVTKAGVSGATLPAFNDLGFSAQDGSVVWADQGVYSGAGATGSAAGIVSEIEAWVGASTTIAGYAIPNWGIAAAVAVGLYMFAGKRGRR